MSDFQIEIVGLDKLLAAFEKFPNKVTKALKGAGEESSKIIIESKGLQNYPGTTAANAPPTPYYIRGRGTQYKNTNNWSSERLATQWYVKTSGFQTKIGNRASYAKWVHGKEDQATAMADIGWKKLFDVAKQKKGRITKIYQAWVNKLLKELNLL